MVGLALLAWFACLASRARIMPGCAACVENCVLVWVGLGCAECGCVFGFGVCFGIGSGIGIGIGIRLEICLELGVEVGIWIGLCLSVGSLGT